MNKLLSALLIVPAIAFAAPLAKPVAIAVRTAAEADPELKPLWEAVALADLQIIEARTARDAALKEADAKIGGFIRSDAGLVIEGLRKELGSAQARIKQSESDLSAALLKLRNESAAAATRQSELLSDELAGTITATKLAEETAALDAKRAALADKCRGIAASIPELRAGAEAITVAIAAQQKRIADARASANANLPGLDTRLSDLLTAKAAALAAFRQAAKAKLLAVHPESADTINAYFGK
jgi:chromosome segregation ATPase